MRPAGKNAVQVVFPENKDLNLKAKTVTYYYYKNELIIVNNDTKTFRLLDYEARPFIVAHICMYGCERSIPPQYILVLNELEKSVKIYDLLPVPKSKELESELVGELAHMMHSRTMPDNPKHEISLKKFVKIFNKTI